MTCTRRQHNTAQRFCGYRTPKIGGRGQIYLFWTTLHLYGEDHDKTFRKLRRIHCVVRKFHERWSTNSWKQDCSFHPPSKDSVWAINKNHGIPHVIKLPTSSAWHRQLSSWLTFGMPTFLVIYGTCGDKIVTNYKHICSPTTCKQRQRDIKIQLNFKNITCTYSQNLHN